jgi:GrpB-like predicted nucleotidyltransferase (UPF0157 family)
MSSEDPQIGAHDRLRRVTVGEPARQAGPILLEAYSDRWPELFEVVSARVRAALGGRAMRLEHVGSTSVPGLTAKPIIDMCLVVEDSADEAGYLPMLEAAGYVLRVREEDWHQHRMFKGPAADINLHVFSAGCPEIERMLAFRDRLRGDRSARNLYDRTKQELAHRHGRTCRTTRTPSQPSSRRSWRSSPLHPGMPGRRPSGARS